MAAKSGPTFIQSAIPANRGRAEHIERDDDIARTVFNGEGLVEEVHTPQETLQRIHETMHARHSAIMAYPFIRQDVADIIEDCRLHLKYWPWPVTSFGPTTPHPIWADVNASIDAEVKGIPRLHGVFAKFATALRADAVRMGITGLRGADSSVFPKNMSLVANDIYRKIMAGNHYLAAKILQAAFVDPDEKADKEKAEKRIKRLKGDLARKMKERESATDEELDDGLRREMADKEEELKALLSQDNSGYPPTDMRTVELPLVHETTATGKGYRLATSGARIYRPALRRPVLPQRLFIKPAYQEPAGAIVFDASSSMSVSTSQLLDCCTRAPLAAIAYYAGDDCESGTLWVFAKDGMRADRVRSFPGGNSVDGPAMDWLLQHDGRKIMVTDRGFCGARDSSAQLLRLMRLEEEGEITVYESYDAFQAAFPPIAQAAA